MVSQRAMFKLLLPYIKEVFDEFLHLHCYIFKGTLMQI